MESGMDEKRVECGKQHLKQKRVSSESTQIVARDILWVTLSVLLFIKGSNCCASLGRAAFFFFFLDPCLTLAEGEMTPSPFGAAPFHFSRVCTRTCVLAGTGWCGRHGMWHKQQKRE